MLSELEILGVALVIIVTGCLVFAELNKPKDALTVTPAICNVNV